MNKNGTDYPLEEHLSEILFNTTMISTSVGKNIKEGKSIKDFKASVFEEVEILTNKNGTSTLTEEEYYKFNR